MSGTVAVGVVRVPKIFRAPMYRAPYFFELGHLCDSTAFLSSSPVYITAVDASNHLII